MTQEKGLSVEGWHYVIPDGKPQLALKKTTTFLFIAQQRFSIQSDLVNSDACHQGAGGGDCILLKDVYC